MVETWSLCRNLDAAGWQVRNHPAAGIVSHGISNGSRVEMSYCDLRVGDHRSVRVHDDAAKLSGKQRPEFDIADEILFVHSVGGAFGARDIDSGRRGEM